MSFNVSQRQLGMNNYLFFFDETHTQYLAKMQIMVLYSHYIILDGLYSRMIEDK